MPLKRSLFQIFSQFVLLVVVIFSLVLFTPNKIFAQSCGGVQCPNNYCGPQSGWMGGYWTYEPCSLECTPDPDTCSGGSTTIPCPQDGPYPNQSICFEGGNSGCIGQNSCNQYACDTNPTTLSCFQSWGTAWCCDTPEPTLTPPLEGGTPTPTPGGGTPTPTPGGGTPTPTPTPTPYFVGNIYDDPEAVPGGIGGTDNLCVGETAFLVNSSGGSVSINRAGESKAQTLTGASYTIIANTNNSDYTVSLQLPFPPTDPNNPWQCACNADPSDPYRCLYTNQQPNQGLTNFFVKTGSSTTAWFQTLGGSSWASGSIESLIPATTCTPPTCTPALIASDPEGDVDSAGFPLTDTGVVVTSETGDSYIHESSGRSNALQAKALGVSVPIENYDYFYDKFGDQALILPNAGKPIVGSALSIYRYSGDLTLDETNPWNLTNTEKIVVFIDGNLTIDDTVSGENRITTVATGGDAFLMFIVSGDITITSRVGYSDIYTNPAAANIANVEGVFIADGLLTIAGQAGVTDRKFIGAGTFVGWSGVDLARNFDDGDSPELNSGAATEAFVFRPDFIINAPRKVKSAQMTWREIEPRF